MAQRCIESASSPFPHRLRLLQKWWQIESHDWLLICNRRQLSELDGTRPELEKGSFCFSCGGTWIPELIEAGLSATAEICHRARESPCIRTSYEIQRQLQHKVPRVRHLSCWHKCLPHTVHSTGHSKSSWVLWALIGLDLARTMCLKWGSGWHCPGLNWKSVNLLRSAFPLKARSLQNTLRAFGLWRTRYNEVQCGDFSSPSFIYFAAWTLHSTNAERYRSQKGLKNGSFKMFGNAVAVYCPGSLM